MVFLYLLYFHIIHSNSLRKIHREVCIKQLNQANKQKERNTTVSVKETIRQTLESVSVIFSSAMIAIGKSSLN